MCAVLPSHSNSKIRCISIALANSEHSYPAVQKMKKLTAAPASFWSELRGVKAFSLKECVCWGRKYQKRLRETLEKLKCNHRVLEPGLQKDCCLTCLDRQSYLCLSYLSEFCEQYGVWSTLKKMVNGLIIWSDPAILLIITSLVLLRFVLCS